MEQYKPIHLLDYYSVRYPKIQTMGRHVTPLGHHYTDSSQPVFVFIPNVFSFTFLEPGVVVAASWILQLPMQSVPITTNDTLCDKVCQWLATGLWFFPGTPVSSTNKTDSHDITEILLKVALNTINQTLMLCTCTYRKRNRYQLYSLLFDQTGDSFSVLILILYLCVFNFTFYDVSVLFVKWSHLHRHTFSNKVVLITPSYSSYDIAVQKMSVYVSPSVMFLVFNEFPTLLYDMADKLIVQSKIRNTTK